MTDENDGIEWRDSTDAEVMDAVCLFEPQAKQVLVLAFPLLVISLFALPYLKPNTAGRILLVIDFGILTVLLLVAGVIVRICGKREQDRRRSFSDDDHSFTDEK